MMKDLSKETQQKLYGNAMKDSVLPHVEPNLASPGQNTEQLTIARLFGSSKNTFGNLRQSLAKEKTSAAAFAKHRQE
jgi:hypothetical protein